VIERFLARYPRVKLRLRQGYLPQIAEWVNEGSADLFIATAPAQKFPDLLFLPCREMHRIILTRPGHPLLSKKPSLRDLAGFPIITYGEEYSARAQIERAFEAAGLEPNIVLSATDADIMKTYVDCGLGVAIVAHPAYDKRRDIGLRAIDASHLFPSSMVNVGLRRHSHVSQHARYFIELFAPALKRRVVDL
jgi:LysR family cys regulon transcriptional activator